MHHTALLTALATCAVVVGACSNNDYARTETGPSSTNAQFTRALSAEYADMADHQWIHQIDNASGHFRAKAIAASRGEAVPPDTANQYGPGYIDPGVVSARQHLIAAFKNGADAKYPAETARAQANYDCWLNSEADPLQGNEVQWAQYEGPERNQKFHVRNCREEFQNSMNALDSQLSMSPDTGQQ